MTQKYVLNFTDPFKPAFYVSEYTSNGPKFPISPSLAATATDHATSFVFYGKGHPNYGERIQENILHLLENFSGDIEPQYPVPGQLWYTRYTHIKCTGSQWFEWDDDTGAWVSITVLGSPSTANGAFWFDTGDNSLKQAIAQDNHPMTGNSVIRQWLNYTGASIGTHESLGSISNPNAAGLLPQKVLRVWDGLEWKSADATIVGNTAPNTETGKLWFSTSESLLKINVGGTWTEVGEYLKLAGGTMLGDIDMDGIHRVTGLPVPSAGSDAATKSYVDAQIGGTPSYLNDLIDVNAPTPGPGAPFLKYNSGTSQWVNTNLVWNDLSDVSVTLTEVDHLSGVTSSIQAQLNSKLPKSGGTMTGPIGMGTNPISDLPDPTNPQDAATMQYVIDYVAAYGGGGGGGTDIYLSGGTLDSVVGSPTEGYLTLTMNDLSTHTIAGFAVQGHTHNTTEIPFTPQPASLLAQISPPVTNADDALYSLDSVVRRRTSPRRIVLQTTAPTTTFSPILEYEVGLNKLMVFLNGIKQVASYQGQDVAQFSVPPDPSSPTGLSAAISNYTFDISVDGGAATSVTIDGANAQTHYELLTEINAQLTSLVIPAVAVAPDGDIEFYSDTHGASSTVALSHGGGANLLFTSLTNFSGFLGGWPGADYAYREVGTYGEVSDQITFLNSIPSGQTLEFIVLGDSGIF